MTMTLTSSTNEAASTAGPPTPKPSKLRDSCNPCAFSKVKCSKEKPACSRCKKRNISCEYLAHKRPGRKQTNPTIHRTPAPAAMAVGTRTESETVMGLGTPSWLDLDWSTTSFTPFTGLDRLMDLPSNPASPRQDILVTSSDLLPNVVPTAGSLFPSPNESDPSAENFFISPSTTSLTNGREPRNASPYNSIDTGIDVADAAFTGFDFEAVFPGLSELSEPPSSTASRTMPPGTTIGHGNGATDSLDPACCCLVQALAAMRRLFPEAPRKCGLASGQNHHTPASAQLTLESILDTNKRIIKIIGNILRCSCSQDDYLLAILSVVCFRMLGLYAEAAREPPAVARHDPQAILTSSPISTSRRHSLLSGLEFHNDVPMGGYSASEPDSGRSAAQVVLGELHRVQSLVNSLAHRLEVLRSSGELNGSITGRISVSSMSSSSSSSPQPNNGRKATSACSGISLHKLETDLRNRLGDLSAEIIDILRDS